MAQQKNASNLQYFKNNKFPTALAACKTQERSFTTKDGDTGTVTEIIGWFSDNKYNYKLQISDSNTEGVDHWVKVTRFEKKNNNKRYV